MPAAEPTRGEGAIDGRYIGLISGTSMDGIDAALVDIVDGRIGFVTGISTAYDAGLRARLVDAIDHPDRTRVDQIGELDVDLGVAFAEAALRLLDEAGISAGSIRAIGSHGQTVRHRADGPVPFTMQIADPNVIAARTGITTVADFRRRDVALGGEGAPLAPAFHGAMFAAPGETRVAVNLGGIANITVLHDDGRITGFDTGPANGLMDVWIGRHRNLPYDADGRWAAAGAVNEELLDRMAADPYFDRQPPKSTGREYFNADWLAARLDGSAAAIDPVDVQATLCELTARTVADAVERVAPACRLCLACGGGARNSHLISRLAKRLPGARVAGTDTQGIAPEWVESAGFAWLASRTLGGLPGNVAAVTGARSETVLGAIYPA